MVGNSSQVLLIPNEYHRERLDVVLAKLFPDHSRVQLSTLVKAGFVTLDSKLCKPKVKVQAGEKLQITMDALTISGKSCVDDLPEKIDLCVVYEDDSLMVINKPAGLVVHPGAGNLEHTLVNALLYHAPKLQALPRAGIIHRLDKQTTGLLLIAKTITAYTCLVRQMQARTIKRCYKALAQGHVPVAGIIKTFFGRHPRNRLKMAVTTAGKEAVTIYTISKYYPYCTMLDVELKTGRTHQIRVHLAHINYPLIGDQLYGNKNSNLPKELAETLNFLAIPFNRQALHASNLSFMHPETKEVMNFKIKLPDDFTTLLEHMDK